MRESPAVQAVKFVSKDVGLDVLLFPFWWYTKGLARTFAWFVASVKRTNANLGLRIWFRNAFKPMYGDYSIEGRMISLIMRFLVLSSKLVAFVVAFVVRVAVFGLYLLAPAIAIWFLLFQLFGIRFL